MSRAQKLKKARKEDDGDEIPEYETFNFSALTERDPRKASMLLKFGRKGSAHECLVRLSEDKSFIEWEGKWFSRKNFARKPEERRVYLEQVNRFQEGQKTVPFERLKSSFGEAEKNSFSLIYGEGRSLDFCAPTPDMFKLWKLGIRCCLQHIKDVKENMDVDKRFLKAKWDIADVNRIGYITRKDVLKLVSTMNMDVPTKAVNKAFKDVDRDKTNTLDFDEFCEFMDLLRRRPELEFIWELLCNKKPIDEVKPFELKNLDELDFETRKSSIDLERLIEFWRELQGDELTESEGRAMLNEVMTNVYHGNAPVLSYMGWISLISQEKNDIYDPKKKEKYQDMSQPLSNYYIASSHNTYLEGDQLTSKSSVNRYIDDLCNNCRCVELDCWDGEGEDAEPIIYHGHTLTSKIKFEDVVVAIKNYAFKTTPYPLILSIENHCCLAQQEKMAQMFTYEFKDMLLLPDDFNCMEVPGNLPSPEQLKRKIIIKGKKVKTLDMDIEDDDENDELLLEEEEDDDSSTVDGSSTTSSSRGRKFSRDISSSSAGSSASSQASGSTMSLDGMGGGGDDNASVTTDNFDTMSITSESIGSDTSTVNLHRDSSTSSSISSLSSSSSSSTLRSNGRGQGHGLGKPRRRLDSKQSSNFSRSESGYSRSSSINSSSSSSSSFSLGSSASMLFFDKDGHRRKKDKQESTHPALSAITFLGTCKHKSFVDSITNTPCNLMSSFSEGKTLKTLKKKKTVKEWIEHNRHHVSRIYPKGSRVDSSNMDPIGPWVAGNHMVALNYQTPGLPMQLNFGKFRENGFVGYVLKPEYMITNEASPSPPLKITIHIISGQQIPKVGAKIMTEVVDPYVMVSMHGFTKGDNKEFKTKTIKNNGFNPVFDEVFEFKVRHPDVAMLVFRVFDEDELNTQQADFIAFSAIPINCVRQGLRSVSLYDEKGFKKGDFSFTSLLVRTTIVEISEDEFIDKDKKVKGVNGKDNDDEEYAVFKQKSDMSFSSISTLEATVEADNEDIEDDDETVKLSGSSRRLDTMEEEPNEEEYDEEEEPAVEGVGVEDGNQDGKGVGEDVNGEIGELDDQTVDVGNIKD
eukprot:gene1697-3289_t